MSLVVIIYFIFFSPYQIYVLAGTPGIKFESMIVELILAAFIILPSVISAAVLLINPIFDLQKKRILGRAKAKVGSLKKVKTIGITGSYGKTSTKEFLYAILSQKYKVVKTEGNNNTNIGVAYTVLQKVSDDFDYFICEMGAYKIGEIKEMCDIAKPRIGILTGINEQHIELFGSMENTIEAKFELIEALPEEGLAVINKSIKYQVSSIKVNNIEYFSLENADKINVHQENLEFDYKGKRFKTNLLGKHYIGNLLSAIMVAEHLGMTIDEISRAIEKIKPTEYMMRKIEGTEGSVYIDDSYSANPDGVMAALDYVEEAYPEYKKIIVFPGFIELGDKSEKIHNELFDRIGEICETAFILDTKYSTLDTGNKCKFIFEYDFGKTANMLKNILDKNTVVLFESRGAGAVIKKMKS